VKKQQESEMASRRARVVAIIAVAAALMNCSGTSEPRSPDAPLTADVDRARSAWLGDHPLAYRFEVAVASSWFPMSGYYRVQVSDGRVVAAVSATLQVVADFTLTVDTIWDHLLAARARGELNSALFNLRGVPVETDMGPWPVDGGVHYSVRNFAISR
jgi:hypothetical protein